MRKFSWEKQSFYRDLETKTPNRPIRTIADLCLVGIIKQEGSFNRSHGEGTSIFSTQSVGAARPHSGEPVALLRSLSEEEKDKMGVYGDVGVPKDVVIVVEAGKAKPGKRGWEVDNYFILSKKRLDRVLLRLSAVPVAKGRLIIDTIDSGTNVVSEIWKKMPASGDLKMARSSFDNYMSSFHKAGVLDRFVDFDGNDCVRRHLG